MNKKVSPEIRFWKKVNRLDNNSCWIWLGSKYYNGYGQFYKGPNKIVAHRFSYELHYGLVSKDLVVCHKCDVRDCVNPDHLFLGTQKDNLQDMYKKGRNNNVDTSGENNGRSIVSEEDVLKMRKIRKETNLGYKKLGEMFGVSETQATRIIKDKSWNYL